MNEQKIAESYRPPHGSTSMEFGAAWGILVRNFNLMRRYLS